MLTKGPGGDVYAFIGELGACEGDVLSEVALSSSVNGHGPGSGQRLEEALRRMLRGEMWPSGSNCRAG